MLSFQSAAKPAGYEKIITRFSAATRGRPGFLNKPDHSHGNRDWPLCIARFSTNNAQLEAVRRLAQAAIESLHPCNFGLLGKYKRNKREVRDSGARSEIAQWTHHCFPSDV